ncbi:SAF domain-containing protein [Pseudonocardia oroxyli]|uniref:SAF domain-containing protein n=1 Tax=Pseudonocardia oroxyli TaxID=366584 RepID=A0A1G8CHA2_PSEOR|nr:SAF domain-containing protein [Pseudonocardia oroxyli]SDH44300.1 SAF domain-containing protein [Pseudonocardia oroxyli]
MTLRQQTARTAQPPAALRESPRRRGRQFYLSLAAVLGVVGLLAGVAAISMVRESETVIAANRDVPRGEPLTAADLVQVQIPTGTGLASVPWTRLPDVVGVPVTASVERGQLITPGLLRAAVFPAPGMAVMEVSGREGQIPTESLGPGDRVLIVDGADGPGESVDGEIVRLGGTADRRTAQVLVRVSDAAAVARTSMAGRVVVVLVEDR